MSRALLWLAAALLGVAAHAATPAAASVSHAWIRWLPGNLPAGGYARIENHGDVVLRLLGADSPDYGMVMLHRSSRRGGVEHMDSVAGMDVPAHASAVLAPGGFHLMLMHPRHAIAPGDHVRLRLRFSDGASVESDFLVRPANAQGDDN